MTPAEHVAHVEDQRARRHARLRSGRGWLAMVGRIWLDEGETETPVGTIVVSPQRAITLRVARGADVTNLGAPAQDGPLRPGAVLELDGKSYELGEVLGRASFRVWDPQSPAIARFQGVPTFPIRHEWRIPARWTPFATPVSILMPFSSGESGDRESPGALDFEIAGQPFRLLPVVEADPTPRLFVLFGDPTNRRETYPAGRFLYAAMPQDGATILDFNLAMNPACAFNDFVICPLPPPENRLSVPVEAGELRLPE